MYHKSDMFFVAPRFPGGPELEANRLVFIHACPTGCVRSPRALTPAGVLGNLMGGGGD